MLPGHFIPGEGGGIDYPGKNKDQKKMFQAVHILVDESASLAK